ncbi:nicotinamide-nucleotide adenylyltransferase [Picrophilus oshimae]|uniref:Nicotinamide-nucleotide adenylyltransferase n=2 Tax=Picrophilus torridus (strain ATCC 700027 / DSM 9790 / JCM 10055 / NBRC 100828 / KAW 2/3) TaxID=1122961 RepID=NADM_PICTO|nr:nicotinamide-nucleotide adenylyltransferase [Picrophilus oshimae]Q6L2T8.1 RecName: Full=Nicotinamide-nucleotide adenylyltransferase; AltName: Full=NAD(+) diphosphorylase; AltName: Full=NAD(+) pyrophosphorylase; AltName: Full=NMN adenylyltransferase [Picrophilus oshimae DSM 9789]AAT42714.1 nicotinamide-nucleotide adenylyltransferase [Picrophilus oshimae DSM 9789]SMD31501.1 nicotinamide-nucleotide adenylyltransferase [Picrophilus oshimae DSM 9789]
MRAFIVGRFQPFHNGHMEILKRILHENDSVIIGIGSAQFSHTLKDPFTAGERHLMISSALEESGVYNYYLVPIEDVNSNPLWVSHVESLTPPFQRVYTNNPLVKRLFYEKGYEVLSMDLLNRKEWSGTSIRNKMIRGENWKKDVPPAVARVIDEIDGVSRIRDLSESDE